MRSRLGRAATSSVFLAVVLAVIVYTLAGFTLVPWLVARYAPRLAHERLGADLAIADVQFNPYLFKLETRDLRLARGDEGEIAHLGDLLVDFQLSSAFRLAWTLSEVRLDRLDLNVVLQPDGRLNLAALTSSATRPKAEAPARIPRVIVQHLVVADSRVRFTDLASPTPAATVLEPIALEVNDLSTLPDREGRYQVRAALPDGGSIEWRGDVSLRPLASDGEFMVTGLQLATGWRFMQDRLRLAEPKGKADVGGRYRFRYADGAPEVQLDGLHAAVSDLALADRDGAPLAQLARIEMEDASFDPRERRLAVKRVAFSRGRLAGRVDDEGRLDWTTLWAPASTPTRPGGNFSADVGSVQVRGVALGWHDRSRATPIVIEAGSLDADLRASLRAGAAANEVRVDDLDVKLRKLSIADEAAQASLIVLGALTLDGGAADTEKRILSARRIALSGGHTRLDREPGGRIPLIEELTAPKQGLIRRQLAEATEQARKAGTPWRYALDLLHVEGFDVAVSDRTADAPVAYDLHVASADVHRVGAEREDIAFATKIDVRQGGTIAAQGSAGQQFDRANAELRVDGFDIAPLNTLLSRYASVDLKRGRFAANMKIDYAQRGDRPGLRAAGGFRLDDVLVNEPNSNDRLLSCRTLAATEVELTLDPARVAIREVVIDQPGAKLLVTRERQLNIALVVRDSRPKEENRKEAAEKAKATAQRASQGEPFEARIDRIRLRDGTVDFSDQSLILPFTAKVQAFNGAIVGVSTNKRGRAEVKAAGRIDPNGTATVTGALNPGDPKRYMDLRVKFENVNMPQLTPYSATFAGRKIASGRLWLDLQYKIDSGQLAGDNRILLDDFVLGERVQSPSAKNLPLELAVALLKDSKGQIDVAVPVHGNVGDPKFSYGQLIGQALATLVERVATAPFRALGNLVNHGKGGDNASLQEVRFDPGSDRLAPQEREDLDRVAQALRERPQVKLVVTGPYDPARDRAALQDAAAKVALARALGRSTEDAEASPIDYGSAATQRAIEDLLRSRGGEEAMQRFQQEFERRAGRKADRVGPVLGFFGRGSEDRAFYEAMFERVASSWSLPEGAVRDLAERRANAIAGYLLQGAGVAQDRVQVAAPRQVDAGGNGKGIVSTLELGVLGTAS